MGRQVIASQLDPPMHFYPLQLQHVLLLQAWTDNSDQKVKVVHQKSGAIARADKCNDNIYVDPGKVLVIAGSACVA